MPLMTLERIRSMGLLSRLGGGGLPIAVDFGVSSLKVLHVGPGANAGPDDPLVLQGAASLATPDELLGDPQKRLDWQFENLPMAVRAAGARSKRAVCAIPAGQTFCKHMRFQRADGLSTAALVKAAVPQQVGCHPEALLYRHIEVDTPVSAVPGAKAEVICLAASRHLVGRLMDAMRAARLEPVGMHPECLATVRAFDSITRRAEDEQLTTLYLDIGYGTTKVIIAHGRRVVFLKSIAIGGAQFDQAVARRQGISVSLARSRRVGSAQVIPPVAATVSAPASAGAGGGGMPALAAALAAQAGPGAGAPAPAAGAAVAEERRVGAVAPGLTPDLTAQPAGALNGTARAGAPGRGGGPDIDLTEPLEMLTDEIAMCLRYYEGIFPGRRVGRSIFVGGESRNRALCQHIARTLRLPAQVADPLARLERQGNEPVSGVKLDEPQPGWAVAYGLCVAPTDL